MHSNRNHCWSLICLLSICLFAGCQVTQTQNNDNIWIEVESVDDNIPKVTMDTINHTIQLFGSIARWETNKVIVTRWKRANQLLIKYSWIDRVDGPSRLVYYLVHNQTNGNWEIDKFELGADETVEHPRRRKETVGIPSDLRKEALSHHLNSSDFSDSFSVVDRIDWAKRMFVELSPNDVLYVLQHCSEDRKIDRFVPVEYLRLPMENERDPSDADGKRWRGIEDRRTGLPVCVFYISKVEREADGTYEVQYVNYSGPLAGSGGSYIATETAEGWTFRKSCAMEVY